MESHLASVWLGQGLARDDLQQEHEFESVTKIIVNVLDGGTGFPQVAVAPSSESLRKREDSEFVIRIRGLQVLLFVFGDQRTGTGLSNKFIHTLSKILRDHH